MFDKTVFPSDGSCLEPRVHPPGDKWAGNLAAIGSQATATVAAGTNHTRRVVTGFSFTLAPSSYAGGISTIGCNVIDGSTGGSTYLYQDIMTLSTLGTIVPITLTGLSLVGSADTALTIEFSAGVSGAQQAVNIFYHSIGDIGSSPT